MRTLTLVLLCPSIAWGAGAYVDLGSADANSGLQNTQRGDGTDGENDAAMAGPPGDARSARSNRGTADGDFADRYMYFRVTEPEAKASRRVRIGATFYDDPAFAEKSVAVGLQYTNAVSSGPADLANTFSQHPYRATLSGRGRWLRFVWTVQDAGFRTFQQGTSDFRFDFGDARVAADRVDVVALPERVVPDAHLVGVHYYPWYTVSRWDYRDCVTGALRLELVPPQRPALGRYDSSSASVVDRHIRWCAEHGANVLLLEFIAPGSREDQISRNAILGHRRIGDISFAVMYDWAIRFGNGFDLTPERLATAWSDFRHIAREYFTHSSHLKFAGKIPIVLIYVTRALRGDVGGLAATLRDACALEGFDVLLCGDEFYFVSRPSREKIARWDAIFGYDVYCGRGGYWGENGTLELFSARTAAYRSEAQAAGVKFFPSCAPGFNDRAVRRVCADNPAFARRATAAGSATSTFDETFGRIALGSLDAELPLVCVTSFNEWHEDTQIEPTAGTAGATRADSSASGSAYTQGYPYDDYGMAYLEKIRDATIAVSGQVWARGTAAAGARIEVLDGEAAVLERRSFSTGAYAIPSLRLSAGRAYRLRATWGDLPAAVSKPFVVTGGKTVTGFDLEIVEGPPVSRGDCNGDRRQDISDPVALLGFLFRGGVSPPCLEGCEVNGDGAPDIADAVYILMHIYLGGPRPIEPAFPACEPVRGAFACPSGNC